MESLWCPGCLSLTLILFHIWCLSFGVIRDYSWSSDTWAHAYTNSFLKRIIAKALPLSATIKSWVKNDSIPFSDNSISLWWQISWQEFIIFSWNKLRSYFSWNPGEEYQVWHNLITMVSKDWYWLNPWNVEKWFACIILQNFQMNITLLDFRIKFYSSLCSANEHPLNTAYLFCTVLYPW